MLLNGQCKQNWIEYQKWKLYLAQQNIHKIKLWIRTFRWQLPLFESLISIYSFTFRRNKLTGTCFGYQKWSLKKNEFSLIDTVDRTRFVASTCTSIYFHLLLLFCLFFFFLSNSFIHRTALPICSYNYH